MTERTSPAEVLLHPVVLLALAIWLINDHVAKAAWPGLVTGKLSDVASLIVFPLIPIAALALVSGRPPPRAWNLGWIAATGLVMAAINVSAAAASAYQVGLGALQWPLRALAAGAAVDLRPVQLTMDPTDLYTLPALAIPLLLTRALSAGDQGLNGARYPSSSKST